MNPTAGSFTIDPRLQRHFAVFAVRLLKFTIFFFTLIHKNCCCLRIIQFFFSLPSGDALFSIFEKILSGHLGYPGSKFNPALLKSVSNLVSVALQLHQKMSQTFLPTAIRFHYVFNMRDLSNIFQVSFFSKN